MTAARDAMPADGLPAEPGYPPTSRYAGVQLVVRVLPDGRTVRHLRRRVVPPADRLATYEAVDVASTDRLDTLAAAHLGDSLLWWRLADANDAMDPAALVEPGIRLRVPRSQADGGTLT